MRNSQTRRIVLAAMAGISALALMPDFSVAQTVDDIKAKGKLVVGVLVDFPPFGILDARGQPDGYDIELAKLMAKKMGVPVELVPVSGPNRVPYLLTNRVDMLIAALGITAERAKQVDFSNPSATVDQVLYAPKTRSLARLEDIAGLKLGVARGSAQDITLTRTAPAGAMIQRFDDDPSTLQALLSGQVDAIAISTLLIAEIAKVADTSRFEIKFPIQRLIHGIATRKGTEPLQAWINDFLATVKANGELNAIHRKWVGIDFTPVDKPAL